MTTEHKNKLVGEWGDHRLVAIPNRKGEYHAFLLETRTEDALGEVRWETALELNHKDAFNKSDSEPSLWASYWWARAMIDASES